jgi:translation initiation factor IF-3
MDYGKFKYEAAQRVKESRRRATNVAIKEMKYRPKISEGDFDTKTRKVSQFLGHGHKVKITIMFRGREMAHPELGKKILDKIAEQLHPLAKIEAHPKLDGRNMIMVLAPDKRAQAALAKKLAEEAGDADGAPVADEPVEPAAEAAPVEATPPAAPPAAAPDDATS